MNVAAKDADRVREVGGDRPSRIHRGTYGLGQVGSSAATLVRSAQIRGAVSVHQESLIH
jgi:hypothetical protein